MNTNTCKRPPKQEERTTNGSLTEDINTAGILHVVPHHVTAIRVKRFET